MRGPRTILIATVVVTTGVSATILRAQHMLGGSARIAASATGATAKPGDPALASRTARQLLRNGLDYLNSYGDHERALVFLNEATARPDGLDAGEMKQLRQGLEQARQLAAEAPRPANGEVTALAAPMPRGREISRPGSLVVARAPKAPAGGQDAPDAIQQVSGEMDAPAEPPSLSLPPLPSPPPSNTSASEPPAEPQIIAIETAEAVAEPVPSAETNPPLPEPAPEPVVAPPPLPEPAPEPISAPTPEPVQMPLPASGARTQAAAPVPVAAPVQTPEPVAAPAPAEAPEPIFLTGALPVATPSPSAAPAPAPEPALPPLGDAPAAPAEPVATPAPAPEALPLPELPPAVPASAPSPEPTPLPLPVPEVPQEVPAPVEAPIEMPPLPEVDAPAAAPIPVAAPVTPPPIEPEPRREVAPAPAPAAEDLLPPLPTSPVPAAGSVAVAPLARSEVGLRPESLREVEEIARAQEDALRRNPPSMPFNTTVSRTTQGSGDTGDDQDSASRLTLPRAPSPTEPRPIRVIPVPDEFVPLAPRQWEGNRKYWAAASTCHMPLYFQDAVLERYGQGVEQAMGSKGRFFSYPLDDPRQSNQRNQLLQPLYSSAMFVSQIAMLPYNMIMDPPWEAQYDLGYYRPGDKVPADTYYLPKTGIGPPLHGRRY